MWPYHREHRYDGCHYLPCPVVPLRCLIAPLTDETFFELSPGHVAYATIENAVYSNSILTHEVAVTSKPPSHYMLTDMLYSPQENSTLPGLKQTSPGTLALLRGAANELRISGSQIGLSSVNSPQSDDHSKKWMHVIARFNGFQANLALTDKQRTDGITKFKGLVGTLNSVYRGSISQTDNAFLIGSWAKDTCIRPPRDVDMYYVLPESVYHRYQAYAFGVNKQSALLQEVKGKLAAAYPTSVIKGDGPIVLADFYGWTVEIAPAFLLSAQDRSYYVCDTKSGGSYLTTKPFHEVDAINSADLFNNWNVRPLIKMLKCWQANCNVSIKSFALELLAIEFLEKWAYRHQSVFYYDWMCRDFFKWLITRAGGGVVTPGTFQILWLGNAWKTRAESALLRADRACAFEMESNMLAAGDEWQKIFGIDMPRNV